MKPYKGSWTASSKDANCEVLGTDASAATHVEQKSPIEIDKAQRAEECAFEQNRTREGQSKWPKYTLPSPTSPASQSLRTIPL
jgi:hypothetical protein